MNCPYCHAKANLADSAIVYGGRSFGKIWLCSNYPKCDSYVGAHKNSDKPLGRMANKELRAWKVACHNLFDPLWKGKLLSRTVAYEYLQRITGLPAEKAHIAMFDVPECKKLHAALRRDIGIVRRFLRYGTREECERSFDAATEAAANSVGM
jgi:ssDNA-binding Zn-finger/Zn-ribbon topoisomerase 1